MSEEEVEYLKLELERITSERSTFWVALSDAMRTNKLLEQQFNDYARIHPPKGIGAFCGIDDPVLYPKLFNGKTSCFLEVVDRFLHYIGEGNTDTIIYMIRQKDIIKAIKHLRDCTRLGTYTMSLKESKDIITALRDKMKESE